MERAGTHSVIVRAEPDRASAAFALATASELLVLANERLGRGDFRGSFEESRNAIRMASSAILFRDGYIADSLDSTLIYLLKHYPGILPLDDWQRLEQMPAYDSPGLYNMLLAAMGKLKKTGEQEAKEAVMVAGAFIESARAEMGL
jgi:hypothetical protein